MTEISHWLSHLFRKLIEFCEPREIVALALLDTEIAKHLKSDNLWISLFDQQFPMVNFTRYQQTGLTIKLLYLTATDCFNLCQLCGDSLSNPPDDMILVVCPCVNTPTYGCAHRHCLESNLSQTATSCIRQYRCPYCNQTRMGLIVKQPKNNSRICKLNG
jgi:hypothetical protein